MAHGESIGDCFVAASHQVNIIAVTLLSFLQHVIKVALGQHVELAKLHVARQVIPQKLSLESSRLQQLITHLVAFDINIRHNVIRQVVDGVLAEAHELHVVLIVWQWLNGAIMLTFLDEHRLEGRLVNDVEHKLNEIRVSQRELPMAQGLLRYQGCEHILAYHGVHDVTHKVL